MAQCLTRCFIFSENKWLSPFLNENVNENSVRSKSVRKCNNAMKDQLINWKKKKSLKKQEFDSSLQNNNSTINSKDGIWKMSQETWNFVY